jgi:hypothetical protein
MYFVKCNATQMFLANKDALVYAASAARAFSSLKSAEAAADKATKMFGGLLEFTSSPTVLYDDAIQTLTTL